MKNPEAYTNHRPQIRTKNHTTRRPDGAFVGAAIAKPEQQKPEPPKAETKTEPKKN